MFIIKRSEGSWDDYFEKDIFITTDEETAKKYCDKANNLLPKLKEFYNQLDDDADIMDEFTEDKKKLITKLWIKYKRFNDITNWFYKKIELR